VEVVTAVQKVNQRIDESAGSEDALEDDLADLGPDSRGAPHRREQLDRHGFRGCTDRCLPGRQRCPATPATAVQGEIPADDDLTTSSRPTAPDPRPRFR
jgi:hypothetical protein